MFRRVWNGGEEAKKWIVEECRKGRMFYFMEKKDVERFRRCVKKNVEERECSFLF